MRSIRCLELELTSCLNNLKPRVEKSGTHKYSDSLKFNVIIMQRVFNVKQCSVRLEPVFRILVPVALKTQAC